MFRVTFTVGGGPKIAKLLAAAKTAGFENAMITTEDEAPAKTNGKGKSGGRIEPDDIVLLGETTLAKEGSQHHDVGLQLEKLEKKHGPGSVTRRQLTAAMDKAWEASMGHAITGALARGIIRPA